MTMTVKEILDTMAYTPFLADTTAAQLWLDGLKTPKGRDPFEVRNPYDARVLAQLAHAEAGDVRDAVQATHHAQQAWAKRPAYERYQILVSMAQDVKTAQAGLSVLSTLETGQRVADTQQACLDAAQMVQDIAQASLTLHAERQPIGVVCLLASADETIYSLVQTMTLALAAGNGLVIAISGHAPLTALYLSQLMTAHDGLADLVQGIVLDDDSAEMAALLGDPLVLQALNRRDFIPTGTALPHLIAQNKGARSVFVVSDGADLDSSLEAIVQNAATPSGPVQGFGTLVFVQEGVADHYVTALKARLGALHVGNPLDGQTDLVALAQSDKVQEDALAAMGAAVWRAEQGAGAPILVYPCELADPILEQKIKGPVVCVTTFRTIAEAVKLVNHRAEGHRVSVWSERAQEQQLLCQGLDDPIVEVNGLGAKDSLEAFGGHKESGYGVESLQAYSQGMFRAIRPQPVIGEVAPSQTVLAGLARLSPKAHKVSAADFFAVADRLQDQHDRLVGHLSGVKGYTVQTAHAEVEAAMMHWRAAAASLLLPNMMQYQKATARLLKEETALGCLGIVAPNQHSFASASALCAQALAGGNRVLICGGENHLWSDPVVQDALGLAVIFKGLVHYVAEESLLSSITLGQATACDALWISDEAYNEQTATLGWCNNKVVRIISGKNGNWLDNEERAREELHECAVRAKERWFF